jgi:hypothetical protein
MPAQLLSTFPRRNLTITKLEVFEIWMTYKRILGEFCPLRYGAKSIKFEPTFQRNICLQLQGLRLSQGRNQREAGSKQNAMFYFRFAYV